MPVSEATLSASPSKPQLQRGSGCPSSSRPCMGTWTWPSSPAMPAAPLTMRPAAMTPPPRPVPTIAETDECRGRVRAEADVVGVERGRVAVVVVDDGQAEPLLERAAEVEAAPARVREVGGAPRRDDAVGAGRAGRVEPHGPHAARARCRCAARIRSKAWARASTATSGPSCTRLGSLDQPSTRKPLDGVEHGRVVLVAAVVEADDDPVALHVFRPLWRIVSTAPRVHPGSLSCVPGRNRRRRALLA